MRHLVNGADVGCDIFPFDTITAQAARNQEASQNLRAMMRCLTLPTHTASLTDSYVWMGTIPAVWASASASHAWMM